MNLTIDQKKVCNRNTTEKRRLGKIGTESQGSVGKIKAVVMGSRSQQKERRNMTEDFSNLAKDLNLQIQEGK